MKRTLIYALVTLKKKLKNIPDFMVGGYYLFRVLLKELELENGKGGLLPLINVFSAICVNFIYGGRVGGIPPRSLLLIGVN